LEVTTLIADKPLGFLGLGPAGSVGAAMVNTPGAGVRLPMAVGWVGGVDDVTYRRTRWSNSVSLGNHKKGQHQWQ